MDVDVVLGLAGLLPMRIRGFVRTRFPAFLCGDDGSVLDEGDPRYLPLCPSSSPCSGEATPRILADACANRSSTLFGDLIEAPCLRLLQSLDVRPSTDSGAAREPRIDGAVLTRANETPDVNWLSGGSTKFSLLAALVVWTVWT